jgi:hypothetical protein
VEEFVIAKGASVHVRNPTDGLGAALADEIAARLRKHGWQAICVRPHAAGADLACRSHHPNR